MVPQVPYVYRFHHPRLAALSHPRPFARWRGLPLQAQLHTAESVARRECSRDVSISRKCLRAELQLVSLLSLLLIVALALSMPATACAGQVAMSVEMPAGQHRSLRLRNLVKDVALEVTVQVTDKVALSVTSELDCSRYPMPEDPVFVGIADQRLVVHRDHPEERALLPGVR